MQKREKTINGRQYQMLLPPVRQAMPLCTRVAALLGPALGSIGNEANKDGWNKFSVALQAVDPDKVDKLIMDSVTISHLCFENKPISGEFDFNKHFDRYRSDTYQVCCWALWECVRDFLPEWNGLNNLWKTT